MQIDMTISKNNTSSKDHSVELIFWNLNLPLNTGKRLKFTHLL